MIDSLIAFFQDGTQFPGIYTFIGSICLALYVCVGIIRSAINRKLLSDYIGHPVLVPVATVILFVGLIGLDHLRSPEIGWIL